MAALLCAFDPKETGNVAYRNFMKHVLTTSRAHPKLPNASEPKAPGVLKERNWLGHSPIPLDPAPLPPRYDASKQAPGCGSVKQEMHDLGVAPVLASIGCAPAHTARRTIAAMRTHERRRSCCLYSG